MDRKRSGKRNPSRSRKAFDPSGKLKWEKNFYKGIEHGPDIQYYEDGSIEEESNWFMGERDGEWNTYQRDGTKTNRGTWAKGLSLQEFEKGKWNSLWEINLLPLYVDNNERSQAEVMSAIAETALPTYSISASSSPSNDLTDSVLGDVHFLPKGIAWPTYQGKPLSPLLQIKISDIANPPSALEHCDYLVAFAAKKMEEHKDGKDMVFYLLRPGEYEPAVRPYAINLLTDPRKAAIGPEYKEAINIWDIPAGYTSKYQLQENEALGKIRPRLKTKMGGWPSFLQPNSGRNLPCLILQVYAMDFAGWECGSHSSLYLFGDGGAEPCFAKMG